MSWANPAFNRERSEEAHDLIVKSGTTPGPFRLLGRGVAGGAGNGKGETN